jgi:hypothetical protein
VPERKRNDFMRSVLNRLDEHRSLDNRVVDSAIYRVLSAYGISARL